MKNKENVLWHYDLVRSIALENFLEIVGSGRVISLCIRKRTEIMIFLGINEQLKLFEVRVYKSKPNVKYIRQSLDKVGCYRDKDEYTAFYFLSPKDAILFVERLEFHNEYYERPVREINKKI